MKIVAVIPARYKSSRFPGKPLVRINGVPMIVRVWRQVRAVSRIDEVIVATDDERIAKTVRSAGGDVVMTDSDLPSGTDRVAAAVAGRPADIVVNVQGDEPLIDPKSIDSAIQTLLDHPSADMATLAVPLQSDADLRNPNTVKVLLNHSAHALYFSRSPIPRPAAGEVPDLTQYLRHIGLYVYRRKYLEIFVGCPPCWSETVERLEQLRALHYGGTIAVGVVDSAYPGVDTPEDVAIIENILNQSESRTF